MELVVLTDTKTRTLCLSLSLSLHLFSPPIIPLHHHSITISSLCLSPNHNPLHHLAHRKRLTEPPFARAMMEKGKQRANFEEKVKAEPVAECEDGLGDGEDDDSKKKKISPSSSGSKRGSGTASRNCQAERCTADLAEAKQYHRRHKVCEQHSKAPAVVVAGVHQRFCQQCSRFHELSEFDENKRSCRRRLAGHNERRRKNPTEPSDIGGSSGKPGGTHQMKELACGQVNDRGRIQITIQENATYKHFQIR